MQISSLLLVLIIAIGSMGINIMSYCCNHKEVKLFASMDYGCNSISHSHHSHTISHDECCGAVVSSTSSCCETHTHSHDIEYDAEHLHTQDHCTTSDLVLLKPVKNTDYNIVLCAIEPIVMQIFGYDPHVCLDKTFPYIDNDYPPIDTGRDILAKNATLLI